MSDRFIAPSRSYSWWREQLCKLLRSGHAWVGIAPPGSKGCRRCGIMLVVVPGFGWDGYRPTPGKGLTQTKK